MQLPEGFSLRGPTESDLEGVHALLTAFDVHHFGSREIDAGYLLEEWRRARFDLARDAWVVIDPAASIVGYAEIYDEEPHRTFEAFGRVHPSHQGRGLGSALVDRMERRALEHLLVGSGGEEVVVRNAAVSVDPAAHALLEARGYDPARHFWHMEVSLDDGHLEPPAPPRGILVRGFRPGLDELAIHSVLEDAFAGHWGSVPISFSDWNRDYRSAPSFDAGLWFAALDGDRVVGALLGRYLGAKPWIDALGVLPAWRGRGIGASLLRTAFAEFRRRKNATVTLNVDAQNETGATVLYERVGMRPTRRWDIYERRLQRLLPYGPG
jgi:mycothiol synthase